MLTLRDTSGSRMLTEAELREEIRTGDVGLDAEVRTPGAGFAPITDTPFSADLQAPVAIFARRLRSPPLPRLALLVAGLGLAGLLITAPTRALDLLDPLGGLRWFSALVPQSILSWLLVILPAVVVVARVERAVGALTVLLPALISAVVCGLWVTAGETWGLHLAPLGSAALVGACVGAGLAGWRKLPLLRRGQVSLLNALALIPALLASAPPKTPEPWMVLAAAGLALALGCLRTASVLRPRLLRDGLLAVLVLLLPMGYSALVQYDPGLLIAGSTQHLEPAGVSVWVPPRSRASITDDGIERSGWERTWRVSTPDGAVWVRMVGSPGTGFAVERELVGDSATLRAVYRSVTEGDPYRIEESCARVQLDCARAHYLAGDAEQALKVAQSYAGNTSSQASGHALQARIWQEHPELAPDDLFQQILDRLLRDVRYASNWGYLETMAEALPLDRCADAEEQVRQAPLSDRARQKIARLMAPRCGSWRG